jgi:hypothetical protein
VHELVDVARRVGEVDVFVRGNEPENPGRDRDEEEEDVEGARFQRDPASTPTTSRTAPADRPSSVVSYSERSSSTISSMPPAPSFTGTPM